MNYAAKIEKDNDMGFVVSFPDLPNVNAFGDTQEEALRQAQDALDGAMECDLNLGNTMILPKAMPNTDKGLYPVELSPRIETLYKLAHALGKQLIVEFV